MELATKITVGAINVTATPHPPGVYRRLLEHVADKRVFLGGSDWGTITSPVATDNKNVMHGRICVWAEIDKRGDWYNKKTKAKATPTDLSKVVIDEDVAPNARFFLYAIDLARHLIIFEMTNEVRQSFGPTRALRFFSGLFDALGDDQPTVNVTIIPDEGSVDKILNLPKLRLLRIVVTRPNADDLTDDYARVMERMADEHASQRIIELHKAPKVESLTPDSGTRALAHIAATNGHVDGKGKGVQDSTRSHPKKANVELGKDGTILAKFLATFRVFKPWKNQGSALARYWRLYGGWRAFISQPGVQLSFVFGILCNLDTHEKFDPAANTISIIPNILGFTVGALAIILALSSSPLFSHLTESGDEQSLFMKIVANFVHFIIAQCVALLVAILTSAYPGYGRNTVVTVLLTYAIITTFSTVVMLFQMASVYNASIRTKGNATNGKDDPPTLA